MEDLATKIIPLVQFLIPGFVTTVIFYWLSAKLHSSDQAIALMLTTRLHST